MTIIERRRLLIAAAATAAIGVAVPLRTLAHGKQEHARAAPVRREQKPWGIAGDAAAVRRTVDMRMNDAMRFTPDHIEVRTGATLRFIHRNDGKLMHEFVIGTPETLQEHAALMLKFPEMEHDEPYMAHVPPGQKRELIWTFNRPGRFSFACLIAGHYQAGMTGRIEVAS